MELPTSEDSKEDEIYRYALADLTHVTICCLQNVFHRSKLITSNKISPQRGIHGVIKGVNGHNPSILSSLETNKLLGSKVLYLL